jgi:cysteinyl-tRNA synthetase
MIDINVRERLEKLGPAQIRLLLSNGGWPNNLNIQAIEWLAEKDQESARLKDASQAEQAELAKEANAAASRAASAAERAAEAAERQAIAAEKANTRATIALAIAIVSIIATVVGIWIVHWDTTHAAPMRSASAAQAR